MILRSPRLITAALALLTLGAVLQAANVDKAISDAESRRRGAENSLREIMAKSDAQLEQARTSYTAAATSQNAWLDLVCRTAEAGSGAAPDMSPAAQAAATALMDWVSIGGKALGLPALTTSFAVGFKKSITQDLIDIGNTTLKTYGSADEKKRGEAIASLKARLRWKMPEELQ